VWHFLPMVNGYSGHIPESYMALAPDLLEFPRADSAAALRRRGVTHVTVNCGLQSADCDETMNVLRQAPDLKLIMETSWEGEPVRLIELTGH
jgi:DNA helicase IV